MPLVQAVKTVLGISVGPYSGPRYGLGTPVYCLSSFYTGGRSPEIGPLASKGDAFISCSGGLGLTERRHENLGLFQFICDAQPTCG